MTEMLCNACGHASPHHANGHGHCFAKVGGNPIWHEEGEPCTCRKFVAPAKERGARRPRVTTPRDCCARHDEDRPREKDRHRSSQRSAGAEMTAMRITPERLDTIERCAMSHQRLGSTPKVEPADLLLLVDAVRHPALVFTRTLPDKKGWWARRRGKDVHWFFIDTFDDGTPPSAWFSDIEDFIPVAKLATPLARWAGPIDVGETE